ncbi:TetR family transcriptional regulator [Actinoplanes lobatus]|uniref:AcrR family transcriptional regulator n=1 Tax=Actinoplanes lobatus TaxID=113568 RepID=A0A7W7HMQ2_9ACTN|nr:TetR/AcrR family transcriptional regulator [Actinoplanes lobatus]MBB4753329.1 AcrR family transcriptional regulator [Actinoplanes lobatus]GGN59661.1 TetR family transcriptional regulator [Actinoplanes lobatus]GIE37864.1 TetR family transcriptional regulator [Actinoplanes lobatus]
MSTSSGRVNRGPAAASENRQAILDAARRLFAARGYHVPLSAIAKEAGVGQGVFYRHFPTRLDLALAVFEENFAQLDAICAAPDEHTFGRLWKRMVELTIESAAFVEMAVDARRSMPDYTGPQHMLALVRTALPPAQAAGLVDARLTVDDVLLAHRMIYGVVATAPEPADIGPAVQRALRLLAPRLGPS